MSVELLDAAAAMLQGGLEQYRAAYMKRSQLSIALEQAWRRDRFARPGGYGRRAYEHPIVTGLANRQPDMHYVERNWPSNMPIAGVLGFSARHEDFHWSPCL